jgi:hypothetical protein
MVVFGGAVEGQGLNDVWTLAPGDAPQWSRLAPAGDAPSPRWGHAAIVDPIGNRLVVFGGSDMSDQSGTPLGDLWELSLGQTPAWHRIEVPGPGPQPRTGAGAAYDSRHRRMIVFGGNGAGAPFPEVWSFDLAGEPRWQIIESWGSPGPRAFFGCAYDSAADRFMLVGGDKPWTDAAWSLDLTGIPPKWDQFGPGVGLPMGRAFAATALDAGASCLRVFGGTANRIAGAPMLSDTWEFAWEPPTTTATLVSLVEAAAGEHGVRIRWQVPRGSTDPVIVYRSEGGAWTERTRLSPGPSGDVIFDDADVHAGARYGYALGLMIDGHVVRMGDVWIDVPPDFGFALYGAVPNPTAGDLVISFSVSQSKPVRIDVVDVAGRRVSRSVIAQPTPGRHLLRLDHGSLAPGVYMVRLVQDGNERWSRVAIVQ